MHRFINQNKGEPIKPIIRASALNAEVYPHRMIAKLWATDYNPEKWWKVYYCKPSRDAVKCMVSQATASGCLL